MAVKSPAQGNVFERPAAEPAPHAERARRRNPVFQFIRECRTEVSKVVWPTRQEATRMSVVVIVVSAATGLILGGFDYGIAQLFNLVH